VKYHSQLTSHSPQAKHYGTQMFAFIVFLSCFGAFKKIINKSFLIFEKKCAFSKHFIQTAPDIVLPAKACKPQNL